MPAEAASSLGVVIGADSLAMRRSGIGRMTLEIARAARASSRIGPVELLVGRRLAPPDLLDRLETEEPAGLPSRPGWKRLAARLPGVEATRPLRFVPLNRALARLSGACGGRLVYHEPNMICAPLRLPTVASMNDLSWHHQPAWHPADRLRWIGRNLQATLRQARRFSAISRFTADTLAGEFGIPPGRIDVVPLAPSAWFRPMGATHAAAVLDRFGLEDRRFVLSISTLEPRKNFDRLLDAFLRLPATLQRRHPLVIAGGKGWGEVLERPQAAAASASGTLRLLGHVADEDLAALCARAAAFAYVSLYEGFGLPVVEAMASGCAVLASGTTAVGEIAEGAALTVDPLDETSIREGLRRLLEDEALSEELRQAGLARAAGYSWARTLDALEACWAKAL